MKPTDGPLEISISPTESDPCRLGRVVDVLVCAGKGLAATLKSLRSAHCRTVYRVFVVENEPWGAIRPADRLRFAAARDAKGRLRRDVVLLRAGTEVYHDWLDRLGRAVHEASAVATASPFCDAGQDTAYPGMGVTLRDVVDGAALDRFVSRANPGRCQPLPGPGGYCVYVRAEYLAACLQNSAGAHALQDDWRHVLAADVFVRTDKTGDGEFPGTEALGLFPAAGHAAAAGFVGRASLRLLRRSVDLERLAGPGPAMLYVTHIGGGGTETHVRQMAARLEQEGVRVLVLRVTAERHWRLERFAVPATPNLLFDPAAEYYTVLAALQRLGVIHLHVQHLLSHPAESLRLVADLRLPYDVTMHDYLFACPRIHLTTADGRYCGEPAPTECNVCLAVNRRATAAWRGVEINAWRAMYAPLLTGARRVFVPHHDVGRRLRRYFPSVAYTERPHLAPVEGSRPLGAFWKPGTPLRVALIGAVVRHKGADVLCECARDARERDLPLHFHIIGTTSRDDLHKLGNVSVTGEYREGEVMDLLEQAQVHCALFLSHIPETFCYTLSIAQAAQLYVLGYDSGAIGARIRESRWGELVSLAATPPQINDQLLAAGRRLRHTTHRPVLPLVRYDSLLQDYYELNLEPGTLPEPHASGSFPRLAVGTSSTVGPVPARNAA